MAAALSVAVLSAFALVTVAFADTTFAPHVAQFSDTDSCAMCHRAHTSASGVTTVDQLGTEHNALIVGSSAPEVGDTELCYTCHGWAGVGAEGADVQEDFESLSYHRIAPEESDYGPSPKNCSSCHDSHGTAKTESDEPYPALLRAVDEDAGGVYQGDEFCAVCHPDRPADVWDGIEIWRQTAHADLTATVSGTEIVCSVCHAPHGSDNTALINQTLMPPSAPATVTVPANDRRLCFGCHPGSLATYSGMDAYEVSSHGSTEESVVAATEWATRLPESQETTRLAGECQVCHSPMGTDDGSGAPIAKLANAEGNALCYRCHDGELPLAADIAALYPTPAAGIPEIVTAFGSSADTEQFGRLQVNSSLTPWVDLDTELPGHTREFVTGPVGPIALGDFKGDGKPYLLMARGSEPTLTAFAASGLSGVEQSPGDMTLVAPAEHMLLADVISDINNRPEVVVATGNTVRFYRWSLSSTPLQLIASAEMTGTITGIASGNILGNSLDEIAVTTNDPDRLEIISATTGDVEIAHSYPTRLLPRGPSVGDMTGDGFGEIAVANFGEPTEIASVFRADGSEYGVAIGPTDGNQATQRAVSTTIGEVLTAVTPAGTSGAELLVLRDDPDINAGASRLYAYTQTATGPNRIAALINNNNRNIDGGGNPTQAVIADVNADGRPEVLISRAGTWPNAAAPAPPGLIVVKVQDNNAQMDGVIPAMNLAGSESAADGARRAWIAVGDLGEIDQSNHAAGAVADTHVSTETAGFANHIECVDCHNVHEATSTPAPAPVVQGSNKGTWGVAVENVGLDEIIFTSKEGVEFEYELCLKCHSGWSSGGRTRDISWEVNTLNRSTHAVEATSTTSRANPSSFETATPAWSKESVLLCTDCHGNADDLQPAGPHTSAMAPLLKAPFVGNIPDARATLCFDCHRFDIYLTGVADVVDSDSTSLFYDGVLGTGRKLHSEHVTGDLVRCSACHVSHGSRLNMALLREDIGFVPVQDGVGNVVGGACENGCHIGGEQNIYTRD